MTSLLSTKDSGSVQEDGGEGGDWDDGETGSGGVKPRRLDLRKNRADKFRMLDPQVQLYRLLY